MTKTRSHVLVVATALVWLAAYLAWTADRFVMPFPLDSDRTLRRMIVCCIGLIYCWPIYLCLDHLKPVTWRVRAAVGVLLACLASAAYAATNIVIVYLMTSGVGYISFAECVQIFMGVCWVYFLWITVYFIVLADTETRAAERKLAEMTEAELRTRYLLLTAQVHPHFLFNTLNTVSGLILEGNPARAEQVTLSLAKLLRQSLETDLAKLVSLDEELASARRYVSILAARFEQRFDAIEDIPDSLTNACVPPMVLQPLIENVFQHGVSRSSTKVTLILRARRREDTLILQVHDDARPDEGSAAATGTGIGQQNIRQRLKLLYGDTALLTCHPLPSGYESRLSIPWKAVGDA